MMKLRKPRLYKQGFFGAKKRARWAPFGDAVERLPIGCSCPGGNARGFPAYTRWNERSPRVRARACQFSTGY
jgi:hypothetical protein